MKFRLLLPVILGALAVGAQTPETLQTFRLEYKIDFTEDTSAVLGTELGPLVAAGTREVRQQVSYDAPAKRITVRTFSVLAGAPKVTSYGEAQMREIENYRVDIKDIRIADRGFLFEGTVAAAPRVFLVPVLQGDPWALDVSWWGQTNPTFSQIYIDFADRTVFVPGGFGVFEYASTANRAPVVVIAPAPDTVFQPEIQLDASKTSDPDNDALTYYWHATRGTVSIVGADTPTPRIQFHSGPGRYEIVLTVTDARGAVSEATANVAFYGR